MTKVFIAGSRSISRLSADIRRRIDRMIERRLPVVVGDANGADKAVQRYLKKRGYERVEVFCSDDTSRNNAGGWPIRLVRAAHSKRDFDYYATKDRAMAWEATVGLMLWDGQSRGTLMNVLRLATQGKPTVVYIGPKGVFTKVRTLAEFDTLVADLDPPAIRQLHAQAAGEDRAAGAGQLRLQ